MLYPKGGFQNQVLPYSSPSPPAFPCCPVALNINSELAAMVPLHLESFEQTLPFPGSLLTPLWKNVLST